MVRKFVWKSLLVFSFSLALFGFVAWRYYFSGQNNNPILLSSNVVNEDPNLTWTAPDIEGGDHNVRAGYPQYIGKIDQLIAPEVHAQAINPNYNCQFSRSPAIVANTFGDLISENLAFVSITECPNKIIGVQVWSSWAGRPTHNENFDQQKLSYTVKIHKLSNSSVNVVDESESVMNTPARDGVLVAYYYYQMPPGDSYRVTASASMRQNGCNNGNGSSDAAVTYTGLGLPTATPVPTFGIMPTPTPQPNAPKNSPTPRPTFGIMPTPTPLPPGSKSTPTPVACRSQDSACVWTIANPNGNCCAGLVCSGGSCISNSATPTQTPTADDPIDEPPTPTPTR